LNWIQLKLRTGRVKENHLRAFGGFIRLKAKLTIELNGLCHVTNTECDNVDSVHFHFPSAFFLGFFGFGIGVASSSSRITFSASSKSSKSCA
jgi:hypothetical protein